MQEQKAIVKRYSERERRDPLGFETGEYLRALDFEHAKSFLKETATEKDWEGAQDFKTREDLLKCMKDYYEFAWEKANNERGISACRSIQHYIAWIWLLGDVDMAERVERGLSDASDGDYGQSILKMIGDHYGWSYAEYE